MRGRKGLAIRGNAPVAASTPSPRERRGFSGPNELLADIMARTHGSLAEVHLLDKPKYLKFVFCDGTQLHPNAESERKQWYLANREALLDFVNAGYEGDPLGGLTFGYSGTGSGKLAALLKACGFEWTAIVTSEDNDGYFPAILKPEGLFTMEGNPIDLELKRQNRETAALQRRAEADARRRTDEALRRTEEARKQEIMRERLKLRQCECVAGDWGSSTKSGVDGATNTALLFSSDPSFSVRPRQKTGVCRCPP
jgi:hypothetical protein